MACHGARRLHEMNENLSGIIAVEAMAGAQGVEMRAPLETSSVLKDVIAAIRGECAPMGDDRILSGDIDRLKQLVRRNTLSDHAGVTPLTLATA